MKVVKIINNLINKSTQLDLKPISKLPDDFAITKKALAEDIFESKNKIQAAITKSQKA